MPGNVVTAGSTDASDDMVVLKKYAMSLYKEIAMVFRTFSLTDHGKK